MTTFLLIRHAETAGTGKTIYGWMPGWPLSEKGKTQAAGLAANLARLPLRAIYSSPLERAVETARMIAEPHRLPVQTAEDLGEFRFGQWEGLTIAELDRREDWRRFNTFRSGVRAPGGEMMIETQTRMVRQFEMLRERHRDATVALVSHGDSLRALAAHALGLPIDQMLRFEISPASVSVVEAGDWTSRVLCLNSTGDVPL